MTGHISWDAIEDRDRNLQGWLIQENERNAIKGIERRFAAKKKDRRSAKYIKKFKSEDVWELDALTPGVARQLLTDEFESMITDEDAWQECINRERETRARLRKVHTYWDDVSSYLKRGYTVIRPSDEEE
jgi:hypothetical protein